MDVPSTAKILLACLLVATFEQPIGTSMQGFVMRHTISWCEGFMLPILVEQQMLQGENGPEIGGKRSNYYPVPKSPEEQSPEAQPTPGPTPSTNWIAP